MTGAAVAGTYETVGKPAIAGKPAPTGTPVASGTQATAVMSCRESTAQQRTYGVAGSTAAAETSGSRK
jgi:hypothetical protein